MRGRLLDIIAPAPARIEPPCRHYIVDRCGGCQLQHLAYEAQRSAKSLIVRDAISRIGKTQLEAPPVEASDKPWRYRRKLTLALRRLDRQWIAGLHRFDAPGDVFPLEDCPITDERVLSVWSTVMRHQHLLPRTRQLRGAVRTLSHGFAFTLEEGPPLTPVERALMPDADTVWLIERAEMTVLLREVGLTVTWHEQWSASHEATATALLQWFRTDARDIAQQIGPLALTELIAAHELWNDWLGRGRVRKFALVAEKR